MNEDIIKEKSKEYASGVTGLNHKRTAAVDFEKGAMFALESMTWIDVKEKLPPLETRVLVKKTGKFVNIGMLMYDTESNKNVWLCGNSNRDWDVDFWMPLPQ